ncbi:hypothetical protein K438DRAFT_10932 [Mycena galopus ATCC 62051]|nr:hypothetical protein K438DRAFT_10932 [Mycena galopus ATCC 62051]
MPTQSLEIGFTSPLIQIDGHWSIIETQDKLPLICSQGTCSAILQFIGTNTTVLGNVQCDSPGGESCFTMQLDGDVVPPQPVSPNSNQFKIATSPTPDQGPHNLTLSTSETNFGVSLLNLSSTVNSLSDLNITNDAPAFVYEPSDAWSNVGNGPVTIQKNAKATFSFKGDRVELYGAVGANGGSYTAQLDEELSLHLTEQNFFLHVPTADNLIFYAAGLAEGNHTVTLISTSSGEFTVDYAIVDQEANSNSDFASLSSSTASSPTAPSFTSASPSSKCEFFTSPNLLGLVWGGDCPKILVVFAITTLTTSMPIRKLSRIDHHFIRILT